MQESERLQSPNEVTETVTAQPSFGGVEPMSFTRVEDYTTFVAEYAVEDEDIILHFYPTKEMSHEKELDRRYWLQLFPTVLDPVARTFFSADFPRLKACFVPEMGSWWLRAYGLAGLSPSDRVSRFLDKFDTALEEKKAR